MRAGTEYLHVGRYGGGQYQLKYTREAPVTGMYI